MTDQANTQEPIHWYESRTFVASAVAAVSSVLALSGHVIDPHTQSQLTAVALDVGDAVAVIAALWAARARAQSSGAPIKQSAVTAALLAKPPGQ